ncbi:hypothetical protein ACQY0O_001324 [Thecaphora frezii]
MSSFHPDTHPLLERNKHPYYYPDHPYTSRYSLDGPEPCPPLPAALLARPSRLVRALHGGTKRSAALVRLRRPLLISLVATLVLVSGYALRNAVVAANPKDHGPSRGATVAVVFEAAGAGASAPVSTPALPAPVDDDESEAQLAALFPPATSPYRRSLEPIRSQLPLTTSDECLDLWIAQGRLCPQLKAYAEHGDDSEWRRSARIDVLYTWVNGSDPNHSAAISAYQKREDGAAAGLARRAVERQADGNENRFRSHDELRYSMRSVARHVKTLAAIHVVSPDFALQPDATSADGPPATLLGYDTFRCEDGADRNGQIPFWLNMTGANPAVVTGSAAEQEGNPSAAVSTPSSSPITVRFHHDWSAFRPSWALTPNAARQDRRLMELQIDYKHRSLPTFNSMAAESMLGEHPGLSEHFVYSNDDFFFGDDVTTGDFYSPLYGAVLRMDPNMRVESIADLTPSQGEWASLHYTNWLLDRRFGARRRPYVVHLHRAFSRPLLTESKMMFAREIHAAAKGRFRDRGRNVATQFLAHHFTIERHREALLWSFFVLRLDGDSDGAISLDEWYVALREMGAEQFDTGETSSGERVLPKVAVPVPKRSALANTSVNADLLDIGWPVPLKTKYVFTSHDGYPHRPPWNRPMGRQQRPQRRSVVTWPAFGTDPPAERALQACALDLDRCFVRKAIVEQGRAKWVDIFATFAFAKVDCGDCLIYRLMGQSGARGAEAFLPPRDRRVHYRASSQGDANNESGAKFDEPRGVAHLPLSPDWKRGGDANDVATATMEAPCFTAACAFEASRWPSGSSARLFALQLVQRYAYAIGNTPSRFTGLRNPSGAKVVFNSIQEAQARPSATERLASGGARGMLESQERIDDDREALLCLNDDMSSKSADEVDSLMREFFQSIWPTKAHWEL